VGSAAAVSIVALLLGWFAAPIQEITVRRLADRTETTLTLALRDRDRVLPINLVFQAVHMDRPRRDLPDELALVFVASPLFAGSLDPSRPHLALVLDEGPDEETMTGNVDPQVPIGSMGTSMMPLGLEALQRLARAQTIRGHIFHIQFTISAAQIRQIEQFDRLVRRHPR
jgi:hypothetical protein